VVTELVERVLGTDEVSPLQATSTLPYPIFTP